MVASLIMKLSSEHSHHRPYDMPGHASLPHMQALAGFWQSLLVEEEADVEPDTSSGIRGAGWHFVPAMLAACLQPEAQQECSQRWARRSREYLMLVEPLERFKWHKLNNHPQTGHAAVGVNSLDPQIDVKLDKPWQPVHYAVLQYQEGKGREVPEGKGREGKGREI